MYITKYSLSSICIHKYLDRYDPIVNMLKLTLQREHNRYAPHEDSEFVKRSRKTKSSDYVVKDNSTTDEHL